MIELYQFPWSPFCLVQKQILAYSGIRYKTVNVSSTERSAIWRLTKHRYYQLPVVKDGKTVVFETDDTSQVIAKYLDSKLKLGLFPEIHAGLQDLIWPDIEENVKSPAFKLNDADYASFVPAAERLNYLRFRERKYGRGCMERWQQEKCYLYGELSHQLRPFELMLQFRDFLLDDRLRFLDFDLYGMLSTLLFTGNHSIPKEHTRLRRWYDRVGAARVSSFADLPGSDKRAK